VVHYTPAIYLVLVPGRKQERCAYADYPLLGTIGTLYKVVGANLKTQIPGAQLEGLAEIRAPIGIVHALAASAVQSYVMAGSQSTDQPLSKL
jgi:hypothetical protein